MDSPSSQTRSNRRTATKIALAAAAMFGFGFALVPLYNLACQVAGLNGKTGRIDVAAAAAITQDTSRTVTVEFTGNATTGLPWEFHPMTKRIDVRPGETIVVNYYVRNTTGESLIGQAVPSVAPSRAAPYFKKIECFCFTRQALKAGESREMPVRFTIMPDLAPEVHTITLSYAFFNVDKASARKYGGDAAPATPVHDHARTDAQPPAHEPRERTDSPSPTGRGQGGREETAWFKGHNS